MDIPEKNKTQLVTSTINQIEGEIEAKAIYTVFISHARCDNFLSNFFYYYLLSLGFKGDLRKLDECEVFYSTSGMDTNTTEALANIIKNFLISANNDVLILASQGFLDSQFCMFEGGAIWATKAVSDCKVVAIDYESIPKFLTNGKPEATYSSKDKTSYILTRETYNTLIDILSKLVKHLNANREIRGETIAKVPQFVSFPDEVELKRLGKTVEDYMDSDILEYWNTYVMDNIDDYVTKSKQADKELAAIK